MWARLLKVAGLAWLAAPITSSYAADEAFVFDTAGGSIEFVVHHHGLSLMKGSFKDFSGQLRIDPDNPQGALVEVSIRTASVDAGHSSLDGHLRSRDFFNVERFPIMTFKSTRVDVTGNETGRLRGELTLLGITHPLVLDVTLDAVSPGAKAGNDTASFTATGTLTRTAFGMDWGPSGFAEDVDIRIEVAAQRL